MEKQKKTNSIILQVAVLFLIGIIITGLLSLYAQRVDSTNNIKEQTESMASNVASEVEMALKEYPSFEWLIKYWYDNYENMDIEYDADYGDGSLTEIKYSTWCRRHPNIPFKYATLEEIESLADYDKKLYAEIAYSWLITRIDQIKQANNVDFLFCVLPNEAFDSQFFMFSAADPDSVRGTSYGEVYPIGISVRVDNSQRDAMMSATRDSSYLTDAGAYVDYYTHIGDVGGRPMLIGLTYNLSSLMDRISVQTRHHTMIAAAFQVLLSALSLALIYFFLLKPLKKVQEGIRIYKNTKNSEMVKESLSSLRFQNEMKELSQDVTELAEEMDNHITQIEEITKERERIGTELNLASKIQSSMLPSEFPPFPDRHEFDIFASMSPAKEVGGDFYDFFFIDEDHLVIAIADVSGKSIPGALFMMTSKLLLENQATITMSPGEILTGMNNAIVKNNQAEMFVTVWIGVLEVSTGKLKAANAGHEYPTIMRAGGDFELYKDKHGFVVGGMEGLKYKEYDIELNPGDKIFVYTDGVPEATNIDNELYGTDRMIEALNKVKDGTPEDILNGVRNSVDEFVKEAEQFDDLTMMCIVYKG